MPRCPGTIASDLPHHSQEGGRVVLEMGYGEREPRESGMVERETIQWREGGRACVNQL